VRPVVVLLIFALGALACASNTSSKPNRYMALQTSAGSTALALSATGQITGPNLDLAPTPSGYRGMADSMMVELRSDGEHIQGTISDRIVDLHVNLTEDGLLVRGMFGGRLGRLDASNVAIKSTFGRCTYELEAKGAHYEGQRACGRASSVAIPVVRPVALELPAGFERLRPDRQAMLLAIMLGQ
jgi:hypothetical protein